VFSRRFFFLLIALAVWAKPSTCFSTQLEASPLFSFYSGDSLRASLGATLQMVYRITPSFWMGLEGFATKARYEGNTIAQEDILATALGTVYWNVLGNLGDSEGKGQPIDLYTAFSLGPLALGEQTQLVGSIGGGMGVHFSSLPWLALKFDLKNLFYVLDRIGDRSFQSDMILSLGASFLF